MQYEIVFKGDRNVHIILAFLKLLLLLKVPRGRWLLVLLRRINVYSRSQRQNNSSIYTYMQTKANSMKQYIITKKNSQQNKAKTILHITTIMWT